jgi:glycerol uptake facilitator-like aquaporin
VADVTALTPIRMRPGPIPVRRLAAEALGTASLTAAVVGSGMAVTAGGSPAAQLVQPAVVVGAAVTALILAFGPVSGGHLNPVITLADAWFGGLSWAHAGLYVGAQLVGAGAGVVFTNLTHELTALSVATTERAGAAASASEAAATAGLLIVVFGVVRSGGGRAVAPAVGAYLAAATVFTASDAFANPALTLARTLSDTWTGIAPASVPGFLGGQLLGMVAGIVLIAWLYRPRASDAARVVVPTRPRAAGEEDLDRPGRRPKGDPAGRARLRAESEG